MVSFTLGFKKAGKVDLRRDKRFFEPAYTVEMGDYRYDSTNWSLGGLLLHNYEGYFFTNMLVMLHISLKGTARDPRLQSAQNVLSVEARVVRNDRKNRLLALKFVKLTPAMIKFFERNYITHQRRLR